MTHPTTPLEWQPLWAAMDSHPDAWIPTTERMYWDMLECVPPRAQAPRRFLVGEAKTHNERGQSVHACFWEPRGGEVFARHLTVDQFWQLRHVDAPGAPDLFPGSKPPRARPRVLMHVTDATDCQCGAPSDLGKPMCVMKCIKCGTETEWLIFDSVTEAKRGIPCESCNKPRTAP